MLVVDLDAPDRIGLPHGRQVLAEIAREADASIPRDTRTVNTPSGGQHLYFRLPDGVDLRNTAGMLGTHIDTRGTGGYVVGPGSIIQGRRYRVVCAAEPQPLPDWLLDRLRPRAQGRTPNLPMLQPSSAYVAAAVRGEAERVAHAPVGTRNDVLFRAAARLGRFVAAGQLPEADVRSALGAAAAGHVGVSGFDATEVERTIGSALRRATVAGVRSGPHRGRPNSLTR